MLSAAGGSGGRRGNNRLLLDCLLIQCSLFEIFISFNPLTARVKPWVLQSFLTFDPMDGTLKCNAFCFSTLYSS